MSAGSDDEEENKSRVVIAEEDDQKCPAIDHEGHNGSSASVDNTCEHNQKLGKVSNQPEGGEEPGPVPITNSYMHMLADMPLTKWLEYLPPQEDGKPWMLRWTSRGAWTSPKPKAGNWGIGV